MEVACGTPVRPGDHGCARPDRSGGSRAGGRRDDVVCTGVIGAIEVKSVLMPDEVECTLEGTGVLGDVRVLEDADLDADDISVRGSVQAQRADSVDITSFDVRNLVQVQEGARSG
jgi:hypothetical protein